MSETRFAALVLLCAACAVGPDFQRPAPPEVTAYLPPGTESNAGAAQHVALGEKIPRAMVGPVPQHPARRNAASGDRGELQPGGRQGDARASARIHRPGTLRA